MLELRVELPDGSRLHIPAAWTDMAGVSQTSIDVAVSTNVGRLSHFLHLGSVVDSLLGRSRESASGREGHHAVEPRGHRTGGREEDGNVSTMGEVGRDSPAVGGGGARSPHRPYAGRGASQR